MHTYNNFTAQNVKQMYMYPKEIKFAYTRKCIKAWERKCTFLYFLKTAEFVVMAMLRKQEGNSYY